MAAPPQDLKYLPTHEWHRIEGDTATIGISAYAAEQLGDVVFVELPEIGKSVKKGEGAAVVESVKAASDVYSPVTGEVTETNTALDANPQTVNEAAEAGGWFMKLKLAAKGEADELMDEEAYAAYLATL